MRPCLACCALLEGRGEGVEGKRLEEREGLGRTQRHHTYLAQSSCSSTLIGLRPPPTHRLPQTRRGVFPARHHLQAARQSGCESRGEGWSHFSVLHLMLWCPWQLFQTLVLTPSPVTSTISRAAVLPLHPTGSARTFEAGRRLVSNRPRSGTKEGCEWTIQ